MNWTKYFIENRKYTRNLLHTRNKNTQQQSTTIGMNTTHNVCLYYVEKTVCEPRQITWTTRTFDSFYGANATGTM